MRYRLDLVLKPAEGALIRVLGMVERRGFAPHAVNAAHSPEDGRWQLQLLVDGHRPPETLRLQLQKVYDCESVRITAVDTDTLENAA